MENQNRKTNSAPIWPAPIVFVSLILACILFNKSEGVSEQKEAPRPGIVWSDESKREYAGMVRDFYRGAEQKFYIDRKPFGSLDGVRIKAHSDSGNSYDLKERQPETAEEDAFLILQDIAKREHPARFSREEILNGRK
jgi:hypothetical protein